MNKGTLGPFSEMDQNEQRAVIKYFNLKICAAIEDFSMENRRDTIWTLAESHFIPKSTVHCILHANLGMNKVFARWIPQMLTNEQMQCRVEESQLILSQFEADQERFLDRFVTQDETWVHHSDLELKCQSCAWKHPGSPLPKKFQVIPSSGKVMASVFWDSQGVIMIDYFEKRKTISRKYFSMNCEDCRKKLKRHAVENFA